MTAIGISLFTAVRRRPEEARRESEERYRALFENANDAIATSTLEGIFTKINRATERLLGLSREEVIGQPSEKFLTPTSAAYKVERIRRALAGEHLPATFELEVVNKNGKVIPVEARACLIRNPEGHPIGYQGIYRDITERKALEQQRADFLAMLSHDIRNPLGVILGYAEMLLEEEAIRQAAGAADLLERVLSNALTIYSLVTNYLDLTRIEAGQLILAKRPLQLDDLLLRVRRQYETEARRRRIRLECQLQLDLPLLEADAVALERVFANLLHNALKFTPEGGQVTIRSARADGEVVATIDDTGPGIRAEMIPLLFEKYQRVDQEEALSGVGLGLFIVRSVVAAHGGRVVVDSTPGAGTCFSVCLPLEAPEGKHG
ncbi:MAG TPA: PAS domain S-box protein [Candidatus Binatia bacterium]|nr:PAS domain S-box protein [Candidatus Binatia bacterium]